MVKKAKLKGFNKKCPEVAQGFESYIMITQVTGSWSHFPPKIFSFSLSIDGLNFQNF